MARHIRHIRHIGNSFLIFLTTFLEKITSNTSRSGVSRTLLSSRPSPPRHRHQHRHRHQGLVKILVEALSTSKPCQNPCRGLVKALSKSLSRPCRHQGLVDIDIDILVKSLSRRPCRHRHQHFCRGLVDILVEANVMVMLATC